jgi:hypothetical protein
MEAAGRKAADRVNEAGSVPTLCATSNCGRDGRRKSTAGLPCDATGQNLPPTVKELTPECRRGPGATTLASSRAATDFNCTEPIEV